MGVGQEGRERKKGINNRPYGMTSGGSAVSLPAEAGKVLYNLKFSVPIFFGFMSVKKKSHLGVVL